MYVKVSVSMTQAALGDLDVQIVMPVPSHFPLQSFIVQDAANRPGSDRSILRPINLLIARIPIPSNLTYPVSSLTAEATIAKIVAFANTPEEQRLSSRPSFPLFQLEQTILPKPSLHKQSSSSSSAIKVLARSLEVKQKEIKAMAGLRIIRIRLDRLLGKC